MRYANQHSNVTSEALLVGKFSQTETKLAVLQDGHFNICSVQCLADPRPLAGEFTLLPPHLYYARKVPITT